MKTVAIIRTGTANVASVAAAFKRLDIEPRFVDRPSQIKYDEGVVLPGVGSFAAAMSQLHEQDFVDYLIERISNDRPTLAICLGLQLFCNKSEESPGCQGLGVIEVAATRFQNDLLIPQLGWNEVRVKSENGILRNGFAYFANSYRLTSEPNGWQVATTNYGGEFVSAIERGPVLACQFHPELSSHFGRSLLKSWIAAARTCKVIKC